MPFIPLNDKVLIKEDKKSTTDGGIYIPEVRKRAKADLHIGEVVALPTTGYDKQVWGEVKVGSMVHYSAAVTIYLTIDKQEYHLVEMGHLHGILVPKTEPEAEAEVKAPEVEPTIKEDSAPAYRKGGTVQVVGKL